MKIDALIFDLGGVIINLDTTRSFVALKHLQKADIPYTIDPLDPIFMDFEVGKITGSDFKDGLRKAFHLQAEDRALESAWNAMLLDIPAIRLNILKNISLKKRTFLLSNTNEIHLEAFQKIIRTQHGLKELDILFEKTYYSHLIGMRKPNVDIFEYVIRDNDLRPETTLFLDDSPQNIEGAQKAGLQTLWIRPGSSLEELDAEQFFDQLE